jgi:hypothetical protein
MDCLQAFYGLEEEVFEESEFFRRIFPGLGRGAKILDRLAVEIFLGEIKTPEEVIKTKILDTHHIGMIEILEKPEFKFEGADDALFQTSIGKGLEKFQGKAPFRRFDKINFPGETLP